MNVFFGVVSRKQVVDFDLMRSGVEEMFENTVKVVVDVPPQVACGYLTDGGAVLGKAQVGENFLIYLGFLQKPLPGWRGGSPLDDPDATAAFLLARYREYGTAFLNGIDGQYALALYDSSSARLLLACDPRGYRRLFYRCDNDRITFSTNLTSMTAAYGGNLPLDRSFEDFLLSYEFLPWGRSLFQAVKCLEKGMMLEFSNDGMSNIPVPAPRMARDAPQSSDENSIVRQLHDEFMLAMEDLCPTDAPIAVLLGGFDSALVAAALVKLGRQIETFSFRFSDERFNQRHIDTLVDSLGHKHTWVDITPEVIREGIQKYPLCFNQPVGQMHYVMQTAHACSFIRSHGYHHCITGDGCDEVFLGYPTVHKRAKLFQRLGVLPQPVVRVLLALLGPRFLERRLGHVYRLGRNVIRILGRDMPARGHISNRVFDEVSLDRLRKGSNPRQEKVVEDILHELADELGDMSLLRLAYHGKSSVGLNRNKLEGCSAYSGLTMQSPFQHPGFVGFAGSLSEELMRPKEKTKAAVTGKYVLMRMAEDSGLLPPDIIYQQKASPVTAPVDYWYMSSLQPVLLDAVKGLCFDYDSAYVEDLVRHKWAEDLFRRHVGLSHYASHALSLLVTYASFTRYISSR